MAQRRSLGFVLAVAVAVVLLPGPAIAATTDAFGRVYGGQVECLSCHDGLLASDRTVHATTPHGQFVVDVRANPSALRPLASSTTLWPSPGLGTLGIRFGAANAYLMFGDVENRYYVGIPGEALPALSPVAIVPVASGAPADDMTYFSGAGFDTLANSWHVTAPVTARAYVQSCAGCHNLGVTRPSADSMTLANGASISPTTPSRLTGLSIQCENCHGTGSDASLHETRSPQVLAWTSSNAAPGRLMSAEVCGQCHVDGTTIERNFAGSGKFSSANGYTPDEPLADYFTPTSLVPTADQYLASPSSYKFYPNEINRSMRHPIYNEWLKNKAANGFGHVAPTNAAVIRSGGGKCLGCHSGEGFLERIGDPIVPAAFNVSIANSAWGITCQVCHSAHDTTRGLSLRVSTDPSIGTVDCSDCHNWQFEVLGQQIPSESAFATGYPGMRVRHPQREMNQGRGLFGVADADEFMPEVECADCHMPRASTVVPLPSHRFHVMLPEDAEEYGVPAGGDSCSPCHPSTSRHDLQEEIEEWQHETESLVNEATSTMAAARTRMGVTLPETTFITTTSVDPEVIAYKKAFHNRDFVQNDASEGAHNPPYAHAGLRYAISVARSIGGSVSLSAPVAAGYGTDVPLMGVVTYGDGGFEAAEPVRLQARPVGEVEFTTFATTTTNGLGAFTGVYRFERPAEVRAVWDSPSGEKASPARLVVIEGYGPLAMVDRISGADRYATSVAASKDMFVTGAVPNIVLASGADFADALSASGLAGAAGSPLLLTAPGSLPDVVATEIDRISPDPAGTTVWLVGGDAAIGPAVAGQLAADGYSVERIGGVDRYDTAARVASTMADILGDAFPDSAFVVNGKVFADGIAVAPVSYSQGIPVLLTAPDALPAATADAMDDLGIASAHVVGGTSAVSDAVLAALPAGSSRIAAGGSRYDTAARFADWAIDEGLASAGCVGVASGQAYPDALSAGAPVGAAGGVVLLSRPDVLPDETASFLSSRRDEVDRAALFGGTVALSDAVRVAVYEVLNR